MKNFRKKIKPVLIAAFWIACSGAVITLLSASVIKQKNLSFTNIVVNVDESNGMLFAVGSDETFAFLTPDRAVPSGTSAH